MTKHQEMMIIFFDILVCRPVTGKHYTTFYCFHRQLSTTASLHLRRHTTFLKAKIMINISVYWVLVPHPSGTRM